MFDLQGPKPSEIFLDILKQTSGTPEGVPVKPFRVKYIDDIDSIDILVNKQYLKHNYKDDTYRLHALALIFLPSDETTTLLCDIDAVLELLREQYRTHIERPVLLSDMCKTLGLDRLRVIECIQYLRDIQSIGVSLDLMAEDASITPLESLLTFSDFKSLIHQRFKDWNPEYFKEKSEKPHGNTEVYASKREEVLGAAIAVMSAFSEQCMGKNNKFVGSRIAKLIDEKSPIWWPDLDEPPMSHEVLTKTINKYLNSLK